MAEKNEDKKADPPAKRGGLGRGLGALIPSAPLGGSGAGKGHFWSALDNPPNVDPATAPSLASSVTLPSVSRETTASEDSATPSDTSTDAADSEASLTQKPDVEPTENAPRASGSADVSRETTEGSSTAVDRPDTTPDEETGPVSRETVDLAASADGTNDRGDRDTSQISERASQGGVTDSPASPEMSDAAVLIELDPADIVANPKNPRQVFDEDDLTELSESVREFGLLQPIVVRRTDDDRFELVMGERRLRASRMAGLTAIPVIVRRTDDDAMLRDALLENIHRVQLHPLEEAAAYQQLIDEFGVTHDELAQRIKRSRPVISNTIRLLKLPAKVQNRVAAGVISGSHARALLALESTEQQEALATRIVAEGLSVRATEEAVTMANGDGTKRRTARRRNFTAPALSGLADKLSDHFDTRATVQLGRTKGKIVVEFASVDDLERIVAMMAPHLTTERLRDQVEDVPRED